MGEKFIGLIITKIVKKYIIICVRKYIKTIKYYALENSNIDDVMP